MSHIKPMDMNGADLSAAQHAECAANFEDLALSAFKGQHVEQEAGRGV